MHAAHCCREHLIELNDDLIRLITDSRHDTDTGCRHDGTILTYVRCLYNRPFGFRQKTITDVLRHVAQVHIEIVRTFSIDLIAHRLVRLIRRAELDCMSTCQRTVTTIAHRSTCLQSYTERFTLCVQFLCALCQCKRNRLGHTGGCKTTHAQDVTMLYQFGSLFGCHKGKCHIMLFRQNRER